MKRLILLILILFGYSESRALDNFWYSATAYNAGGTVLNNSVIFVRVTVSDGTHTNYIGKFTGVNTDQYGVFTVRVSSDTLDTGGGVLSAIEMNNKTAIKVEVSTNSGTNWIPVAGKLLNGFADLKSSLKGQNLNWFFMPSVDLDTSNPDGTTVVTVNLYDYYKAQFSNPAVKSTSAPSKIPNFPAATDLYYYITGYDTNVFTEVAVSDSGVLTYKVKAPASSSTYMNIIFVLK